MPPRRLEMLSTWLVEASPTGIVAIQRGLEGM
jgi:hypothetical protein